jgi:hypothetical protein
MLKHKIQNMQTNISQKSSSSSQALPSVVDFGFQYNFTIVSSFDLFLRDWDANPTPNPQPGGPGYLS